MTTRLDPDIVLLVLDTQRRDRLSCYGYEQATSPHIDAFAADATRFTNAFSPAQWTIPAHASMFTGEYPSRHNTIQSSAALPADLPTLAERLRDGGYFTAAFCNNPLVGVVNNGLRRGFYSFLNYSGLLTSRPNQAGVHPGLIGRYRQFFKRILAAFVNRLQDAFARSDALLLFSFSPVMVPLWQTALSFKGNTPKSLNDAARLLIERRGVAPGQPIFSFINLMGVHMPYHPQPRYLERFAPHVLRDRDAQRYLRRFNSDVFGWLAPLAGIEEQHRATLSGVYDAEVAGQDAQVGAFLQRLRETGALDRTLLIICSDHGEHLGEKRLLGHTISAYNELIHVPLLVRNPGGALPCGAVVDHVVSTRRVFHTALAAAGLANDAERVLSLAQPPQNDPDGGVVFSEVTPLQNVLNLMLRNQARPVRERRFDQTRRVVVHDGYKLIQTGDDEVELFYLADDPDEQLNLRDIIPERVEAMQELLQVFLNRTQSPALSAGQAATQDDPLVRRRLQDLGYLE